METLMDLYVDEVLKLLLGLVNRLSDGRVHDHARARGINIYSDMIIVRDRLERYELRRRYGPTATVWNVLRDSSDSQNHLWETNGSMSAADPTQRKLIDFEPAKLSMSGYSSPQLSLSFSVIDDNPRENHIPNQSVPVLLDIEERIRKIVEPQSLLLRSDLDESVREFLPTGQSRGPFQDPLIMGEFSNFQSSIRSVLITEENELAESSAEEHSYEQNESQGAINKESDKGKRKPVGRVALTCPGKRIGLYRASMIQNSKDSPRTYAYRETGTSGSRGRANKSK